MPNTDALMAEIQLLSPDRVSEVEDVVYFIAAREERRVLTRAAVAASGPAFATV